MRETSRGLCGLVCPSRTQGAPVFPGSSRVGIEPKTTGWLGQDRTTSPSGIWSPPREGRQTAKTCKVGLSYHRRQGSSPRSRQAPVTRPGLTAGALGPSIVSLHTKNPLAPPPLPPPPHRLLPSNLTFFHTWQKSRPYRTCGFAKRITVLRWSPPHGTQGHLPRITQVQAQPQAAQSLLTRMRLP
jgi:hypothetical protein